MFTVEEDLLRDYVSCFIYGLVFQVISEKNTVLQGLLAI